MPEYPTAYFEQDYALITRMGKCLNIYDTVSKMSNMVGKEIHQLTTSERRLIRYLVDLGLLFT